MSQTVLALHHTYRVAGGEERAAEQLATLAEELGERVAWLRRDSSTLSARDAARGLLRGGTGADEVTEAVRSTGADLVHAHNLFPTFGPRALRAARDSGAAVVVHLHNSRLVCAVATNVRDGQDCTACHGSWSLPGVQHRCRGSLPESVAYAAALPRWRREVLAAADAVIVPSRAAATRLRALGVPLDDERLHVVGGVAPIVATASTAASGRFALLVGRLAPEKDLRTAIDACTLAGLPLVLAGDGPERADLMAHAGEPRTADAAAELLGDAVASALPAPPVIHGSTVFVGHVDDEALTALRGSARVALSTSTAHETFGLSALEAMAAALPTVASAIGALPELVGAAATVPPGDAPLLAERLRALAGDNAAGVRAADRARELASPAVVAEALRGAYAAARRSRDARTR